MLCVFGPLQSLLLSICLSFCPSIFDGLEMQNIDGVFVYVGIYHRGFSPLPHFTLFIFPCLRVPCITER